MIKLFNVLNIRFFLIFLTIFGYHLSALPGLFFNTFVFAEENEPPQMDLVFVIDNSGSMKKNDPHFITPKVVETFIRQLPKSTQVSMVLFDQKVRLLGSSTVITEPQAAEKLLTSLKKIDYRGQRTNTPLGMERAIYELKINGRPDSQKGIVLITDGIVDTGNAKRDQQLTDWLKKDLATQCRLMGIRIFGIALTEAADFSLIQALAMRTEGEYFRTYEASEISSVLKQIQVQMTPKPKPVLKPLALLPEPKQTKITPKPETKQKPNTVAPTPEKNEKTVVTTSKGAWMLSAILGVLVLALLGVLIFFFIQNAKRKNTAATESENKPDLPNAELEDLEKICGEGKEIIKLEKACTNIGRSKHNDIIIPEPAVSGYHATIEFRNMAFFLEDQRSTNGTRLNGRKLLPNELVRLKSGDVITIAKFDFKFMLQDQIKFGETVMLSMTALADPEAEATIILDLDGGDSKQGLISCMQNHLMQIYGISFKHKNYVNKYFTPEMLDIIATTAHDNLQLTQKDEEQHCTPIIKHQTFYLICSLPASIENAVEWFDKEHGGYTQFIFKWIRSEQYTNNNCEQLSIITFGQAPSTWVSITIVPTHSEPEPVEIMSVDFLNEAEKSSLALDFDNHGRVI